MAERSEQWMHIEPLRHEMHIKGGRTIHLQSLTIGDIASIRKEALRRFQRSQLEYARDNEDILGKQKANEIRDSVSVLSFDGMPERAIQIAERDDEGNVIRDESGSIATRRIKTEYSNWWMSSTMEGMIYSVWLSMRHCPGQESISESDVSEILSAELSGSGELERVANAVGDLTENKVVPPKEDKENGSSVNEDELGNVLKPRRRNRRRGRRRQK